jgi:membrane-associated HD superfamily phosphohydrolase
MQVLTLDTQRLFWNDGENFFPRPFMKESETDIRSQSGEEQMGYFAQAGALHDQSLKQLRDQVKKVMIPLLIRIFQLKLELSQSISLPSRLQSFKSKKSSDELIEQLKELDKDLKVLLLWCQSCQTQIQKALSTPEEELKSEMKTSSLEANPAVAKSFTEALAAQASRLQAAVLPERSQERDPPSHLALKKRWWHKLKR